MGDVVKMANRLIPPILTFPLIFILMIASIDALPGYMAEIFVVFVALLIFALYGAVKQA
jgi:hypothetical protein